MLGLVGCHRKRVLMLWQVRRPPRTLPRGPWLVRWLPVPLDIERALTRRRHRSSVTEKSLSAKGPPFLVAHRTLRTLQQGANEEVVRHGLLLPLAEASVVLELQPLPAKLSRPERLTCIVGAEVGAFTSTRTANENRIWVDRRT